MNILKLREFTKLEDGGFKLRLDSGELVTCKEYASQPYTNCRFSAGLVDGLPPDTVYFMVKKEGQDDPYVLFLRPDEMQAVAWVCSGTLWTTLMIELEMETGIEVAEVAK